MANIKIGQLLLLVSLEKLASKLQVVVRHLNFANYFFIMILIWYITIQYSNILFL